jgi:two-component system chemotaxis sensor kinase CheA
MLSVQRQAFLEEARELLSELESSLLQLEESPGDLEVVGRVFRAMHTIKGSGAMFGFEAVSAFTHEIETVYDLVRDARIEASRSLIDLSLQARDHILAMLEDEGAVEETRTRTLVEAFRAFLPVAGRCEWLKTATEPKGAAEEQGDGPQRSFRIQFRPSPDIFLSGTNPLHLLREIEELGECRIVAQTENVPPLDQIDPERCYLYWDILLTTTADENAIRDVFIFVEDESVIDIEPLAEGGRIDSGEHQKLGEILVAQGALTVEDLKAALAKQRRLGSILVEEKLINEDQLAAALEEQQQSREKARARGEQDAAATIRVPTERLDCLVDLVGELVTVRSRLSASAAARLDPELLAIAEEVERLTEELRASTLNIRMLAIGTTFSRFKRLVRDLSRDLGKQIELETTGGDTELDKTVIEKLGDPLVHIIRNSIDHGIEDPDGRRAAGKPVQGTVRLAAEHSGDSVVIRISDDGKGLDAGAIRRKAVEKGIIADQDELSDPELHNLIFAPGFSTATTVSSVSGRGVGMDVVKKAIDALRGSVTVESTPGSGTVIRIRLPLTLAIIDSLLVEVGGEKFVLPLSLVEECVELTARDKTARHGRNLVAVRGQLIPYVPLRQAFALSGQAPAIEQVVVTRHNDRPVGFVVDRVIGEHQTVIKSLGRVYRDIAGLSGATILGDGKVALILDVPQLVAIAELEDNAAYG